MTEWRPYKTLADEELRTRLFESATQRIALYEIGAGRRREFMGEVVALVDSTNDAAVREEAVWALGKCAYGPATSHIAVYASSPNLRLRQAALWALGETGGTQAWDALVRAEMDPMNIDAGFAAIIGGALRKLRGLPVKSSRRLVARRLLPPETDNTDVLRIVRALEESDDAPLDKKVQLREELMSLDADYFSRYMAYLTQRPAAIRALESDRTFD